VSRHVTFTLESDAVTGDRWNAYIAEFLELASRCHFIDVARTTGARREASAGKDAVAADRRRALIEQLPEVQETAVIGLTRFGEGVLGSEEDQARLSDIHRALGLEKRKFKPSDANDALHLATHLKAGRDYFVTTDQRIHGASKSLSELGVRVVTPERAVELARAVCEMPSGKD
jgi:predicted nucleic acid-binding protein